MVPPWLKWVVVGLLATGSLWAAAHRDPWDPDETRYLQVARETITGEAMLPRFNRQPYADKPAPFFWLLGLFTLALGADSAVTGVLPSLLGLVALALAIPRLGRAAGLSAPVAELGTVVALSCLLPSALSFLCRMDLLFTLWCCLALERLARLARPRSDSVHHHHLLGWLWIGIGLLTKGPLAVVLPLLAAVAMLPADRMLLRRLCLGWGPVLALLIAFCWLAPAALIGGVPWLTEVLVTQTTGRLMSSFAHQEAWWYHLATLPLTTLPWSPVALPALCTALQGRRDLPKPVQLLLAYTVSTLIMLSLISAKTLLYPLPLVPPAGLLAARWLAGEHLAPQRLTTRRIAVGIAAAVPTVLGLFLGIAAVRLPDLLLGSAAACLLAGSLALPAAVSLLAVLGGRQRTAATALALAVPLLFAAGMQTVIPGFNRLLSLRPFGQAYAAAAPVATPPPVAYGKVQPGFLLFTGTSFELLREPDELQQALTDGRLVAINVKEADRLTTNPHLAAGLSWAVVAEIPYRHTRILLIRSPDWAADRARE